MRRPSTRRAFGVAVLAGVVALAPAAAARAESPILGFTERSAAAQQAYEGRFQDGVSPEVIGRTSRALSRRPQLIAHARASGASFEYSVAAPALLRARRLDAAYGVYASRPRDVSVTMTAPYTRRLATKERGFPWQRDFEDVVVGYNAYSPSGDVSGEVVYANYGLPGGLRGARAARRRRARQDRARPLRRVLPRRQGPAGRAARRRGLLIYSDPEDDGFVRGAVYPDGRGGRPTGSSAARSSTSSTTRATR